MFLILDTFLAEKGKRMKNNYDGEHTWQYDINNLNGVTWNLPLL